MTEKKVSPRFGQPFIDELLLSIAAGSLQAREPEEAWDTAHRRASAARRALFGEEDGGNDPSDDDMELLQVGYWVWAYLDLSENAPDEQPPRDVIRKAAGQVATDTLFATKESRKTHLTRKFIKEWRRIMKVIEEQAFDESVDNFQDLEDIAEMFARRQIGFDWGAHAIKKRLDAKLKEKKATDTPASKNATKAVRRVVRNPKRG